MYFQSMHSLRKNQACAAEERNKVAEQAYDESLLMWMLRSFKPHWVRYWYNTGTAELPASRCTHS